jgi:hypothetical protein
MWVEDQPKAEQAVGSGEDGKSGQFFAPGPQAQAASRRPEDRRGSKHSNGEAPGVNSG